MGYSQERLAQILGVEKSTVWRWEAGRADPQPWARQKLAELLKLSEIELQDLLFPPTGADGAASQQTARPGLAPLTALEAFRAADVRAGGGKLYNRVLDYLVTELGPGLFIPGSNSHDVFSAAAGLTEMAGWMAHDAGNNTTAEQHFRRALELAAVSGDRQLTAHIYASLAHLTLSTGNAHNAAAFAQSGFKVIARHPAHVAIRARLHAMLARTAALAGNRNACSTHLQAAEALVETTGNGAAPLSPWTSDFDHGSLASEATRCFHHLGDRAEVERAARRVIELRPPARARSRAFGQLALARVLIAKREPEPASHLAAEVLEATGNLSSALVAGQLHRLALELAPFSTNPDVADFLDQHQSGLARTFNTETAHG